MALATLDLDSLGELDDGAGRAAINGALAEIMKDVDDRGEDGKERTVTIKVIAKKMEKTRNIVIDMTVVPKAPAYKIGPTIAELRVGKGNKITAVFEQHAPDDPRQTTLDEAPRDDD